MAIANLGTHDAIDDCTHAPSGGRTYQESALFVWHDLEAGLGGFIRLSQEPVVGELNCCFGVFTAEGARFRANVTGAPMVPSDRGQTHMGWGEHLRVDLDTLSITADFPNLQATVRFQDFFPRYDWFALVNMRAPEQHHFEVAGRIVGRIAIGGKEFEIDALGYRDRSWGPRDWGTMRATRWWPSVFGPDLCIFTFAAVQEAGYSGGFGYMIRDREPFPLTNVDIGAMLESDAISPRSGVGRFTLPDGTAGMIEHSCTDGILLHVRGYSAVESIGTVRFGDRAGMSNLEVCTNPLGGHRLPVLTLRANDGEGLSRRP